MRSTYLLRPPARSIQLPAWSLDAFDHGKHVVLVNAELDSLIGPILKAKADQAGVVVTHTDGDEPGVAMTLLRYLRSLGLRIRGCRKLKGMVDYYRNPETQRAFAEKNDQDVQKGHFLCGRDQAIHGSHGTLQCHRLPVGSARNVWSGVQVCPGDGGPAARRSDCSAPASLTMRLVRRRTPARLSSFMRNLR